MYKTKKMLVSPPFSLLILLTFYYQCSFIFDLTNSDDALSSHFENLLKQEQEQETRRRNGFEEQDVTVTLVDDVAAGASNDDNNDEDRRRIKQVENEEGLPEHFAYSADRTKEGQPARPTIYSSNEYNLYAALLLRSNYSKNVRPVPNHLDPIIVKVGMCVMMIEDLIERDQTMVMSACVKMFWVDEYLRWNPENYGNLTWLALGSQSIWLPDIAIVNSPEPHALTRKSTNIGVSYRGEVGFFPSGRLATRCNLIITYFPFDWQNCEVRFESWIYPTKYLVIELYPGDEAIDVKEYYDNFQWSLKSFRVEIDVVNYDGKNFSSLTVIFRLRRKPAFYFMYFIFPQLLLAALQTLSHTLPVEHPGRMAMLTALFIGTSVTHSGIAAHIPKSSDTMSLLQVYMTVMSVNLVWALLITFVMLYTVLRYPKCEPSFASMMVAFFNIIWPDLGQRERTTLLYEINNNFNKQPRKSVTKKAVPCQRPSRRPGNKSDSKVEPVGKASYNLKADQLLLGAKTVHESMASLNKGLVLHSEEDNSSVILDFPRNERRRISDFSESSFLSNSDNMAATLTAPDYFCQLGNRICNNFMNNEEYDAEGEIDDFNSDEDGEEEDDDDFRYRNSNRQRITGLADIEESDGELIEEEVASSTLVWQPNPDQSAPQNQRRPTPVIQINGVTYYDYSSSPEQAPDADYDCAYFRGGESGQEVLPVITNPCCPKYHPCYEEDLIGEYPGFVLPLKRCQTCCELRKNSGPDRFATVPPPAVVSHYGCQAQRPPRRQRKHYEIASNDNKTVGSEMEPELTASTSSQSGPFSRRRTSYAFCPDVSPYTGLSSGGSFSTSNNTKQTHFSANKDQGARMKRGSRSLSTDRAKDNVSFSEEADLKKRWLMYCVALDKSIMYVTGIWNIIVPLVLFVLMPFLHDISHVDHLDDD